MFNKRQAAAFVLTLCLLLVSTNRLQAQEYPARSISIITPFAPGVPFDLLSRLFAERLRQKVGVPVIVENVTGGRGLISVQRLAQAKPDGYTLGVGGPGIMTAPLLFKNASFSSRDFSFISPLGQATYILFVNAAVPADDIPSLISHIKANAKNINCGVLLSGDITPLAIRKLGAAAGVELTEIGYRGSTDAVAALLAGDIQIFVATYSQAGPHLQSGKVKAIGVLQEERTNKLPDLPTFKERGFPSLTTTVWGALLARSDTPPEILARLRAASVEVVADATYRQAVEVAGLEQWSIAFEDLQAFADEYATNFARDAQKFKLRMDQ